ncbi:MULTISPECIES: hypothetical protein [Hyphobacterium]|uniref:Uncharacterized protein n=1 Tax=Hyphobacterium vulgare TaxID=1736751 RepID=A0ABV6ZZ63_9PROT
MIVIAMAAALLAQEQTPDPAAAEQVMRSMEGLLDEVDEVSEELEADSGAEGTARAIVRMTEAVFANSPYPIFSLVDRETVIEQATPAMDTLMNYSGGTPSDYSLDYAANAFRLSEDGSSEYAFCERGAETTIVDEMLTDPAGHELNFRICWYGRMGEAEGELIGSYIYQLSNGIYHVQYRGGIAGPDEAGIDERLPMIEALIEPLVLHTVIAPGENQPQADLDAD